jgi:hypothetical protein
LRRQRQTGKQIAAEVEVSPATVSRVLRRLGSNRIRDLEPAVPERRYERENPGEIIHIDTMVVATSPSPSATLAGIWASSTSEPSPICSPTIWRRCRRNIWRCSPGARHFHSVRLLQRAKELDPQIFTKSGIMVGLGEDRNEVLQLMDDLRSADADFLTIGQYLQPTRKHHAVVRFVPRR